MSSAVQALRLPRLGAKLPFSSRLHRPVKLRPTHRTKFKQTDPDGLHLMTQDQRLAATQSEIFDPPKLTFRSILCYLILLSQKKAARLTNLSSATMFHPFPNPWSGNGPMNWGGLWNSDKIDHILLEPYCVLCRQHAPCAQGVVAGPCKRTEPEPWEEEVWCCEYMRATFPKPDEKVHYIHRVLARSPTTINYFAFNQSLVQNLLTRTVIASVLSLSKSTCLECPERSFTTCPRPSMIRLSTLP